MRPVDVDPRLGLSAFNDNLEARLLLPWRRLDESGLRLQMSPPGADGAGSSALKLEQVPVGGV